MKLIKIGFLIFFISCFLSIRIHAQDSFSGLRDQDSLKIGQNFLDFTIQTLASDTIQLDELIHQKKITVLNFWFAACKPCIREIPELNALVARYQDNPDVVFLAISILPHGVKSVAQNYKFAYQIAVDESQEIAKMYEVSSYPCHIVIDSSGKIVFYKTGLFPEDKLQEGLSIAIEEALAEKDK
ncbi:MAG: TlpA disulfide reductase family protein [Microscillaceae bacterium]|nr:TlpA disulfide reductase family protein [Microscillaceae bacterium]